MCIPYVVDTVSSFFEKHQQLSSHGRAYIISEFIFYRPMSCYPLKIAKGLPPNPQAGPSRDKTDLEDIIRKLKRYVIWDRIKT